MSWFTYNEVDFIDGLGSYKGDPMASDLTKERRLRLLKSYLATMDRRSDWCHVDKEEIKRRVERMIDVG